MAKRAGYCAVRAVSELAYSVEGLPFVAIHQRARSELKPVQVHGELCCSHTTAAEDGENTLDSPLTSVSSHGVARNLLVDAGIEVLADPRLQRGHC